MKEVISGFKFELGIEAQDIVTNFAGVVTCRAEYLDGCVQYCLTPKIDKDGKIQESHYFDEQRLVCINEYPLEDNFQATKTGGPQSNTPPMR